MAAGCCSAQPHSPVFGVPLAVAPQLPLDEVSGLLTSGDGTLPFEGGPGKPCQLPEKALMEIIVNLEQERETYLEAVALLHEQLRESQEHYQQLADSHLQITRNLESEVSEGWREAERWEAKFNSVTEVARCIGLDLGVLQQQMDLQLRVSGSPFETKPTQRVPSLNSDACTVVTRRDLDHEFSGEFNTARRRGTWIFTMDPFQSSEDSHDEASSGEPVEAGPMKIAPNEVTGAVGSVAAAVRSINAMNDAKARRDAPLLRVAGGANGKAVVRPGRAAAGGAAGAQNPSAGAVTDTARVSATASARPTAREAVGRRGLVEHVCDADQGDIDSCSCLAAGGVLCERCETTRITLETLRFTEPAVTKYGGWIYLRSPRTIGGPYEAPAVANSSSDVTKTLLCVFDAVNF